MSVSHADHGARQQLAKNLLGSKQEWITRAREALHDSEPRFLSIEVENALATDEHRRPGPDGSRLRAPFVWREVAVPLDDVLSDLARDADVVENKKLRTVLDVFEADRIVSIPASPRSVPPPVDAGPGNASTRAAILTAAGSGHPSGGFVALLLSVLAESSDARRTNTDVTMPVLLHNQRKIVDDEPGGEIGSLTLTAWPGGPPGLHPDPRAMTFSTIDASALEGLHTAYLGSAHPGAGTCVTVAVRDSQGAPVRELAGNSLSAAVAVLLEELGTGTTRLGRLRWSLRPRRMGRRWTITAGLIDGRLTHVEHYKSKLTAVRDHDTTLQVIVAPAHAASADNPVMHAAALGMTGRVFPEQTVADAVRRSRSLSRTFVAGVAAALVLTGLTGTGGALVKSAVDSARATSTAAGLVVSANELATSNPRLAALTALAADDLNPSQQTEEAMAEVLAANDSIQSSATVSDTYVREVEVSDDETTLLTVDGDGVLAAWQLPGMTSLGTLPVSDVRSVGHAEGADFTVVAGSELHFYLAADGVAPRVVKTLDIGFDSADGVFGPIGGYGSGSLMLSPDLRGAFWSFTQDEPFRFDLSEDPRLSNPNRSTITARAVAAAEFLTADKPPTATDLADFFVATSANEVLRVRIRVDDVSPDNPFLVIDTVLPHTDAGSTITALAKGPGDTLLVGTDRGIQWWDLVARRTKEFPYAGWSQQVGYVSGNGWSPMGASQNQIGFFQEPQDGSPRPDPKIVNITGAPISNAAVTSYDFGKRYVAGREDGTVLLLDPQGQRFGPVPAPGSNTVRFTPSGQLIRTYGATPQATSSIGVDLPAQVTREITASQIAAPSSSEPDPYSLTYQLPQVSGRYPYINDATASDRWLVASGREVDARGTIWVWRHTGGTSIYTIKFGDGESGPDAAPDIVADVDFVDGGEALAALNSASRVIRFFSTHDWSPLGDIQLAPPPSEPFANWMASDDRGTTIAVRESPTSIALIDAHRREVRDRIVDPTAAFDHLALSPDGDRLAVIDHDRTVRVLDISTTGHQEVSRRTFDTSTYRLDYDHAGDRLAVLQTLASTVEIVNADDLDSVAPPWRSPDGFNVVDLDWSPTADTLAVGTMEFRGDVPVTGRTYLLDGNVLSWRGQLCALAFPGFTNAEWDTYGDPDVTPPVSCPADATPVSGASTASVPRGALTRADLMAGAPVPELCDHTAGSLVNGSLPNQDPHYGYVEISSATFGDLTGDGLDDAAVVIQCNAGGVPWPPWFALYTLAPTGSAALLGIIESTDPALVGDMDSERPSGNDITIRDGRAIVRYSASIENDYACCPSLPVEAALIVQNGRIAVGDTVRHYDEAAVRQSLVNDASDSMTYNDLSLPASVVDAVAGFKALTVGATFGACFAATELPDEFAAAADGMAADHRYCTIVGAPGQTSRPLLLELRRSDGERYDIVRTVDY